MPSYDEIVVDYPSLTAAEGALAGSQRLIATTLQTLNSDLAPLLSTWEGDGKQAYLLQQTKWNTESDSLNLTLAAIHSAVGTANTGYQETDRRIANAWNAI